MRKASIYKQNPTNTNDKIEPLKVEICETFSSRLMGFMFQKSISENEGLFFQNKNKNIIDASIHMFFMNFDLAVFWLDENNKVIDKIFAKKWHPFYAPHTAAQSILEVHPKQLENFSIGDQLIIEIS